MLAPSLPPRSLGSNKGISLLVSRIKINTGAKAFHYCNISLGTTSRYLSIRILQLPPSGNVSKHLSLTRHFRLIHQHDGALMLWNFFINFAVEQWFGCHATEPGYTGHILDIEFDEVIDSLIRHPFFFSAVARSMGNCYFSFKPTAHFLQSIWQFPW